MQSTIGLADAVKKCFQRAYDPLLIQNPHVCDFDADLGHPASFLRIDRANPHHEYVAGIHRRYQRRQPFEARLARIVGDGSAVEIAACGRVEGMQVRMRVQPEDELLLAELGCTLGHT